MSSDTNKQIETKTPQEAPPIPLPNLFQSGDSLATIDLLREHLLRSMSGGGPYKNAFQSSDTASELLKDLSGVHDPNAALLNEIIKTNDSLQRSISSGGSVPRSLSGGSAPGLVEDPRLLMTASVCTVNPDMFSSAGWATALAPGHEDVNYSTVFQIQHAAPQHNAAGAPAAAAAAAKTDWDKLYSSTLPGSQQTRSGLQQTQSGLLRRSSATAGAAAAGPRPDLFSLMQQFQQKVAPPTEAPAPEKAITPKKRPPSRKKRKRDFEKKWIGGEPSDLDVLMGRGGRTNHHKGNMRYLAEKERLQPKYLAAAKEEKTEISQELVDIVHAWGGRFVKTEDDRWYQVENVVARKKASQTLREINTPEERAAKRARYPNAR